MKLWVALEVDFLLGLALGEEHCQQAIDTIQRLRGHPVVTPSVLQELADQAKNNQDRATNLAKVALSQLNHWGILQDDLDARRHGIVDITARKLQGAGLCEDYQSALILSEAAACDCTILLSYNAALVTIDPATLRVLFLAADLRDCFAIPPHIFVHLVTNPPKRTKDQPPPTQTES